MAIKNYTSETDCFKSLGEIQGALASGGASRIMVEYANKKPVGVKFMLDTPNGERAFALPANVDGVMAVFKKQRIPPNREQAERTAWRNIRDWVLAQMAFIEAGQASMGEAFFPYLTDGQKTLYQAYIDGQLRLPGGAQ